MLEDQTSKLRGVRESLGADSCVLYLWPNPYTNLNCLIIYKFEWHFAHLPVLPPSEYFKDPRIILGSKKTRNQSSQISNVSSTRGVKIDLIRLSEGSEWPGEKSVTSQPNHPGLKTDQAEISHHSSQTANCSATTLASLSFYLSAGLFDLLFHTLST